MKKAVFLFLLFVKSNMHIFAQYQRNDNVGEYSHSIGFSYLYISQNSQGFTLQKCCPALVYNIRLNVKLNNHSSICGSLYPTVGYSTQAKIKSDLHSEILKEVKSGGPFCFEIPILVQYNSGNHSTESTRERFGSFIGAGICYSHYPGINVILDKEKNRVISVGSYISVCATAGIKFKVNKQSFGIRLHYNMPLGLVQSEVVNSFSFSILYNFKKFYKFG